MSRFIPSSKLVHESYMQLKRFNSLKESFIREWDSKSLEELKVIPQSILSDWRIRRIYIEYITERLKRERRAEGPE